MNQRLVAICDFDFLSLASNGVKELNRSIREGRQRFYNDLVRSFIDRSICIKGVTTHIMASEDRHLRSARDRDAGSTSCNLFYVNSIVVRSDKKSRFGLHIQPRTISANGYHYLKEEEEQIAKG